MSGASEVQVKQCVGVGSMAPDFALRASLKTTIALHDFRSRPVVLAFYPADWSEVCGDQMVLLNETLPAFESYRAVLLGISVDGTWCHAAFARDRKLRFPLLSDFEPKGEVARLFGVYRDGDGTSERALIVIDRRGVVQWSFVSPIDVNPGVDQVLEVLDRLSADNSGEGS